MPGLLLRIRGHAAHGVQERPLRARTAHVARLARQDIRSLGGVQKTLLLPLWGRAMETRKPKPLLVDRTAAEIVAKLDFDFAAMVHMRFGA